MGGKRRRGADSRSSIPGCYCLSQTMFMTAAATAVPPPSELPSGGWHVTADVTVGQAINLGSMSSL